MATRPVADISEFIQIGRVGCQRKNDEESQRAMKDLQGEIATVAIVRSDAKEVFKDLRERRIQDDRTSGSL